ncbi:MAG: hypothetical protein R3330_18420, partial [Saprospiraceae bacterium]|nr:hypothetical protein [Saprospiraceae bacterium]
MLPDLRVLFVAFLILYTTALLGQMTRQLVETPATRVNQPPSIDGRIADDPVWQNIPAVTQLWQTQPNAGAPASKPTEIRIAYTA